MLQCINMRFPGGLGKAVTLSCDDGRVEDARLLFLMRDYGIRGTFNLNPGMFRTEENAAELQGRMSREECLALYGDYPEMEIACHGSTHPFLVNLPLSAATAETVENRKLLEEMFGRIVRGMAYPYGSNTEAVRNIMRMCGIAYGRTIHKTLSFSLPDDWLKWDPTCSFCSADTIDAGERFAQYQPERAPALFAIWGHSSDMTCFTGGWVKLEACFRHIGRREDTWYATNIEVCDYAAAFERLQYSADGGRVFNPNGLSIWCSYKHRWYDETRILEIPPMTCRELV